MMHSRMKPLLSVSRVVSCAFPSAALFPDSSVYIRIALRVSSVPRRAPTVPAPSIPSTLFLQQAEASERCWNILKKGCLSSLSLHRRSAYWEFLSGLRGALEEGGECFKVLDGKSNLVFSFDGKEIKTSDLKRLDQFKHFLISKVAGHLDPDESPKERERLEKKIPQDIRQLFANVRVEKTPVDDSALVLE